MTKVPATQFLPITKILPTQFLPLTIIIPIILPTTLPITHPIPKILPIKIHPIKKIHSNILTMISYDGGFYLLAYKIFGDGIEFLNL